MKLCLLDKERLGAPVAVGGLQHAVAEKLRNMEFHGSFHHVVDDLLLTSWAVAGIDIGAQAHWVFIKLSVEAFL